MFSYGEVIMPRYLARLLIRWPWGSPGNQQPRHCLFSVIPQSHRPNRHETDLKPTKIIIFEERSVCNRCWFGFVGLASVYVRADTFVGERSFKHVWKISPRQIGGCLSVMCRFCRGAFGDVSVLIRSPMLDSMSVLDRLYIGHMSADLTPIQGRFKTELSAT